MRLGKTGQFRRDKLTNIPHALNSLEMIQSKEL